MALVGQIEAADRVAKPGPAINDLNDDAVLLMPVLTPAQKRAEHGGAEQMVRRLANRHGCEGLCDRPEHADDAALMAAMLAMLGLIESDTLTAYTVGPESNAPVVAKQAKAGQCTGCGETKPASEFYPGRSRCKSCHQKDNTAYQARRRRIKAEGKPKRTGRQPKPRVRPAEKPCSWCKETKASSEFNADGRAPDGLRSDCRECHNAKRRRTEVAA